MPSLLPSAKLISRLGALAAGTVVGLVSQCVLAGTESEDLPAREPIIQRQTIAEGLLSIELGKEDRPELRQNLRQLMDLAVKKYGSPVPGDSESKRATRFFKAVDDAFVESSFIFPPHELIDLLRNALKARTLSADEYKSAQEGLPNKRRLPRIKAGFEKKEKFHYADCDLSAIVYVSIGERLGLPIVMVEVPQHSFVRWSSPALKMNWDSNDGKSYSDLEYSKRWGVTKVGREKLGWLADMPRDRVLSYWHQMIGNWHERHQRYAEALAAFRLAASASTNDLEAGNTLAWCLATSTDAKLRNGAEAEKIARRVVELAPRANWVDTLAAAQAEKGDFALAVETELRAKKLAASPEWDISQGELIADFDNCIEAYRRKLTYRKAVEAGLIKDPKLTRPYDD